MLPLWARNPASSPTDSWCWRSPRCPCQPPVSGEAGMCQVSLLCLGLPNGVSGPASEVASPWSLTWFGEGWPMPLRALQTEKSHVPVRVPLACIRQLSVHDSIHVATLAPVSQVLPCVSAWVPPRGGPEGQRPLSRHTRSRGMQGLGLMWRCLSPSHRPTWSSSLPARQWGRFCRC